MPVWVAVLYGLIVFGTACALVEAVWRGGVPDFPEE